MYKAPRDKLVCILNCCRVISNLLLNASISSNENPPGADEFLPVLIYVTIKANPHQLHSNLEYIQRFRRKSRLVAETAYYFTHMLSAESFISNIDAKALSMDETEFKMNMESARALLSRLSTDLKDQSHLPNQNSGQLLGVVLDKLKNRAFNDIKDSALGTTSSAAKVPSLSDLENKGAAMLLKENQVNEVFREFPYLFAHIGDLTVSDVKDLLNNYKQLVFKYVCLSKGLGITPASDPSSNPQNTQEIAETTTQTSDSRPIEPNDKSEQSTDGT